MLVPPWPVHSKESYLQVESTPFGYQQRVCYQQPDMYHEEVVDLDTPFAQLLECSPRVYTESVLLLGDQNAGKTTFLHALVYEHDMHFTALTAHLPLLAGTFLNTRLLPLGSSTEPMDEPPFLDTDLARTSLLFTMDDWNVFLEEQGLPTCTAHTAFFVLQLLEIGGDHLDRLMRGDDDAICAQSRQLIARVHSAAYIVNGERASVSEARITERFDYIRRLNAAIALSVFVSRGGPHVAPEKRFDVLDADGHVDVQGLVRAVACLATLPQRARDPLAPRTELALTAERLVHFWLAPRTELYLDRAAWYAHLSGAHGVAADASCLPDAALLVLFDDAVARLAAAHVAIESHTGRFADDFAITVEMGGAAALHFGPYAAATPTRRLRFAVFEPLFDALCGAFVRQGVPSEIWLTATLPIAARTPLLSAVAALEARARAEWAASTHACLLLVEDWQLAQRRLGNTAAGGTLRFPVALPAVAEWRSDVERLLGPAQDAASGAGPRVVLTLAPHP